MSDTPAVHRRRARAWLIAAFVAMVTQMSLDYTGHRSWGTLLVGAGPLCLIVSAWHSGWMRGHRDGFQHSDTRVDQR